MSECRKEVTQRLSLLTEKYINPHNDPRIYWSREVTFDYASAHPIRVDYMKFKPINNTVSGIEKVTFIALKSNHLLKISNQRTAIISLATTITM